MSTFGAIYLSLDHASEFDELEATIKKKGYYFTLRYHESCPWLQLWVDEPENVPHHAKTISEFFPDRRVIGISTQSVVDASGYWDLSGGESTRELVFGFQTERTWETVDGNPQDWESEIFEGANPVVGSMEPDFGSWRIQKLGTILNLPGFGHPAHGETWTREVIN